MSGLAGARIAVVGGGVFGLTAALAAVWRGAEVELFDPALRRSGRAANASGVAAGMLAPAFEAVLDPLSTGHFSLLRQGRDGWPPLLERLGLPDALDRSGAMFITGDDQVERAGSVVDGLRTAGAALETFSPAQARRFAPALGKAPAAAVFTPEDWRLDPHVLMPAMAAAFTAAGGRIRGDRARSRGPADALVIAAGAEASALAHLAPELAHLAPIKGQLLHLDEGPLAGPTLRFPEGYVAPRPSGAVVGATMEPGRRSRRTSAAALARLRAAAAVWIPELATASGRGFAGVRASTPDGLPLVGGSLTEGVFLAVGARRNGWLLAPLVAEVLMARLAGEAHPLAAAFAPQRFSKR